MNYEDFDRIRVIYEESQRRIITPEEERLLREVMAHYSFRARELPRWALLEAAGYAVTMSEAKAAASG